MARALIVGCGCRGQALGSALRETGWQVRGTTRERGRVGAIEAAGIEPALADPDRAITIVELVGDVTLIYWLLASAGGDPDAIAALHGPRLERVLEEIVDTPVRGFVYEATGTVQRARLERGARIVREAGRRWRIPFELVDSDWGDWAAWRDAMLAATWRLAG
jgi:nucleoside-diphosphate-sugar epimerase